jgi:hypothetical protein
VAGRGADPSPTCCVGKAHRGIRRALDLIRRQIERWAGTFGQSALPVLGEARELGPVDGHGRRLPRDTDRFCRIPWAVCQVCAQQPYAMLALGYVSFGMTIQFSDYDGPTGLCIASGSRSCLSRRRQARAFVGSAMQSGIGNAEDAAVAQSLVDSAVSPGKRSSSSSSRAPSRPLPRHPTVL